MPARNDDPRGWPIAPDIFITNHVDPFSSTDRLLDLVDKLIEQSAFLREHELSLARRPLLLRKASPRTEQAKPRRFASPIAKGSLMSMLARGFGIKTIAKTAKRSTSLVLWSLNHHGIRYDEASGKWIDLASSKAVSPSRSANRLSRRELLSMINAGMSQRQMVKQLHKSGADISYAMRQHGFTWDKRNGKWLVPVGAKTASCRSGSDIELPDTMGD